MKALKCDLNKSMLNIGYVGAVLLTTLLCFTAKAYTDQTRRIYTRCLSALQSLTNSFLLMIIPSVPI